jgi:hypothetical protein
MEKEIRQLLAAMLTIMDNCEVTQNEVSWCNNLYDEVVIYCLEDAPDGDYQQSLTEQHSCVMEHEEARRQILQRISNMLVTQNFEE